MNALIRLVFPLIGYLCVGTVLTGALAYGYLVQTGRLSDETQFRIAALLHGVDLDELQDEVAEQQTEDAPDEEHSYQQKRQQLDIASLHFDAMRTQLESSLTEFDYQLKRLSTESSRYAGLKKEVEEFLDSQRTDVENAAMARVVAQIEGLSAKKQAKPIIKQYIENQQIEEVIRILNLMKPTARRDLLKAFDQEEDLEEVYLIQQAMLSDDPSKVFIDEKIEELKALKDQAR
ncbi:MAG: hypothetical protein CMJ58_24140 [Planctomycetaceae bacterium]|nr:hypothetical protein [Planctomycetaceae bacterium]